MPTPSAAALPGPPAVLADRLIALAGAVFLASLPFSSTVALRLTALALALVAVAWADLQHGHDELRIRPPLRLISPLLAWAALAVASLTWSVDARYSASELKSELLYPIVTFLTFYSGARGAWQWRAWTSAVVVALLALGLSATGEQLLFGSWNVERLHADFGYYSTFLVLVFPFLLLLLMPENRLTAWLGLLRIPIFLLGFGVLVTSGALTANRVLWLALATSLAVFALLALPGLKIRTAQKRALLATLAAVLVGLVTAFAAVASYKARVSYPTASGISSSLSQDDRLKVWQFAASKVAQSPALGSGFGRGIHRREMQATLDNPLLWHGHNLAINYLLELGIVGLAALGWVFIAIAREHLAHYRSDDPETRLLGTVGLSLLAGFLVKNITDDFLIRHTGLLFWALTAILLSAGRRESSR